jgi:hypothetical protein
MRRYSYKIAGLVTLVLGNHSTPSTVYNFPTSQAISTAAQNLIDVYPLSPLQSPPLPDELPPPYDPLIPDEDDDDEEFITHTEARTADDLLGDPDNLDPPSTSLPTHPIPPEQQSKHRCPPYCLIIQPQLRSLLFALFAQLPDPDTNGRFFSPLIRYLVLAGLEPDGKWRVAGDLTQDIAACLFTGRLTLYSEMNQGRIDPGSHESYHS